MSRPILNIPLKPVDWVIEGVTLFLVLGIVVYTTLHYSTLPDTIPTHYGFSGKADGFGSKVTLLVLLGALIGMYILLLVVARIPHKFNYVVTLTESNAPRQYYIALQMIRILKLLGVIIFSYIILTTIQVAHGKAMSLGVWFIPLVLVLLVTTIIIYAVNSSN
ncbi:MAG: DUF1648 domain-containing protein [Cyclobacteriaceae bacterium]|nr:DUF1648 domain-containing protein [Cyclobacteriaceae bacterium]